MGNQKQRGYLRFFKSPTILLRLAFIVAVFSMATVPFAITAMTNAKYAASATVTAAGAVAKWDVRLECLEAFPKEEEVEDIPGDGTEGPHPLLLFFEGIETAGDKVEKPAMFVATFTNYSEVSARFTPVATAEAGSPVVDFYKTAPAYDAETKTYTYSGEIAKTGAGVVLEPEESLPVYIVIKNSTFTNLKIGANCEQVD